jgi:hypothetical protein
VNIKPRSVACRHPPLTASLAILTMPSTFAFSGTSNAVFVTTLNVLTVSIRVYGSLSVNGTLNASLNPMRLCLLLLV